jgi:hypothetical protein
MPEPFFQTLERHGDTVISSTRLLTRPWSDGITGIQLAPDGWARVKSGFIFPILKILCIPVVVGIPRLGTVKQEGLYLPKIRSPLFPVRVSPFPDRLLIDIRPNAAFLVHASRPARDGNLKYRLLEVEAGGRMLQRRLGSVASGAGPT